MTCVGCDVATISHTRGMNRFTRWRRRRAANVLLDAYFEDVGWSKTDDDLVVEMFLWHQYGAPKMAAVLADARARQFRFASIHPDLEP